MLTKNNQLLTNLNNANIEVSLSLMKNWHVFFMHASLCRIRYIYV